MQDKAALFKEEQKTRSTCSREQKEDFNNIVRCWNQWCEAIEQQAVLLEEEAEQRIKIFQRELLDRDQQEDWLHQRKMEERDRETLPLSWTLGAYEIQEEEDQDRNELFAALTRALEESIQKAQQAIVDQLIFTAEEECRSSISDGEKYKRRFITTERRGVSSTALMTTVMEEQYARYSIQSLGNFISNFLFWQIASGRTPEEIKKSLACFERSYLCQLQIRDRANIAEEEAAERLYIEKAKRIIHAGGLQKVLNGQDSGQHGVSMEAVLDYPLLVSADNQTNNKQQKLEVNIEDVFSDNLLLSEDEPLPSYVLMLQHENGSNALDTNGEEPVKIVVLGAGKEVVQAMFPKNKLPDAVSVGGTLSWTTSRKALSTEQSQVYQPSEANDLSITALPNSSSLLQKHFIFRGAQMVFIFGPADTGLFEQLGEALTKIQTTTNDAVEQTEKDTKKSIKSAFFSLIGNVAAGSTEQTQKEEKLKLALWLLQDKSARNFVEFPLSCLAGNKDLIGAWLSGVHNLIGKDKEEDGNCYSGGMASLLQSAHAWRENSMGENNKKKADTTSSTDSSAEVPTEMENNDNVLPGVGVGHPL